MARKVKRKQPDPPVNRNGLAQIFGVSVNTIDKWRQKGMPYISEGGNGQAYEYSVADCLAWYEKDQAEAAAKKSEMDEYIAKRQAEFLGFEPDAEQSNLTPAQVKDLASAQLVHMQAAAKRRTLVSVEEMVELFSTIFSEVRSALDGQPDWLDRLLDLSPEQVVKISAYNDAMLTKMTDNIRAAALYELDHEPSDIEEQLL